MKKFKIVILGAGNIGTSLARGLIASKQFTFDEILMAEIRGPRIDQLKKAGFNVINKSQEALRLADLVVMSVKPQHFVTLAEEIKDGITAEHTLFSTITGVTFSEIEAFTGKVPMVRIMPNIALEICESMTCISFKNISSEKERNTLSLFNKMGKTLVIPEEMMGAATVAGACGIAFVLRFMRALTQGGIEIGFDAEMAQFITAQTVKGAARLIIETSNHPEMEIDKVTTPQGITISGLNEMEHQGLSSAVIRGLVTSFNKLENLAAKVAGK
jgi:pyrroline-5-carboxylate reductase